MLDIHLLCCALSRCCACPSLIDHQLCASPLTCSLCCIVLFDGLFPVLTPHSCEFVSPSECCCCGDTMLVWWWCSRWLPPAGKATDVTGTRWNLCLPFLFGPSLALYFLSFFFFLLFLHSVSMSFSHCHFSQASTLMDSSSMFLVVPAPSCILLLFLASCFFLSCSLGLFFCAVPISSFSVPYISLSIPSGTAGWGSSLPAAFPSGEMQPPPPSALTLFSVSFCLAFSLFPQKTVYLPWIHIISATVYSCFPSYYPTCLWGRINLSHNL